MESIKVNNARAASLQEEIDELNQYIELGSVYSSVLHNTLTVTKDKYSKFQSSRIKFLEVALEDNISYLFPDRGFIPKIEYEIFRNKIISKLTLIDTDKNVRFPEITEGDFLQQLIGYTSSITILKLLKCKTFYIDEAFSNASGKSKEKMQPIIYDYTAKDGLQTIMISQSSECYEDLPRREFRLNYDDGQCKLIKTIDYNLDYDNSDLEESKNKDLMLEDDISLLGRIDELE